MCKEALVPRGHDVKVSDAPVTCPKDCFVAWVTASCCRDASLTVIQPL